jgi:hypothetical protein
MLMVAGDDREPLRVVSLVRRRRVGDERHISSTSGNVHVPSNSGAVGL